MSFNIAPVASGYQEIHPYSAMNIDSVKINTSLIMMKECPYTASSQDVSENIPPSALEISLVRGFCTPRPLGNLLGLGECIFQYIPPLGSVRIQYSNKRHMS